MYSIYVFQDDPWKLKKTFASPARLSEQQEALQMALELTTDPVDPLQPGPGWRLAVWDRLRQSMAKINLYRK